MTAKKAEKVEQFPMATRASLLELDDRQRELVQVPEWKMAVWVRGMDGLERDRYEMAAIVYRRTSKGGLEAERIEAGNLRARLAALTIVDDDWKNLFNEFDIIKLGQKSGSALERICDVARRLSGLTEEDVEALQQQLGEAQGGVSGTSSPETSPTPA